MIHLNYKIVSKPQGKGGSMRTRFEGKAGVGFLLDKNIVMGQSLSPIGGSSAHASQADGLTVPYFIPERR